jgi:hypothetical protein
MRGCIAAVDGDDKEAIMVSQDYLFMTLLLIICALTMHLWDGRHSWRH